jgi:hypothetical protein
MLVQCTSVHEHQVHMIWLERARFTIDRMTKHCSVCNQLCIVLSLQCLHESRARTVGTTTLDDPKLTLLSCVLCCYDAAAAAAVFRQGAPQRKR